MFWPRKMHPSPWVIPLIAVGLFLYYLLVYLPLVHRSLALDTRLAAAWERLPQADLEAGAPDFSAISNRWRQAQTALAVLHKTELLITNRLKLEATLQERLASPFQLVEFQNERELRLEELGEAAKEQGVAVDPAAWAGFPAFSEEKREPSLLWVQLAVADRLLAAAIRGRTTAVNALRFLPVQSHRLGTTNGPVLEEIQAEVQVRGSMAALSRWVAALPLLKEECQSLGLPETAPRGPVLFVERVLFRKVSAEIPDEAQLDLRACGLVYRVKSSPAPL